MPTCFGGPIGSILGGSHAVSTRTIHVEDVPPCLLLAHDPQRCAGTKQRAQQVCLQHSRYLLRRCVQERLQNSRQPRFKLGKRTSGLGSCLLHPCYVGQDDSSTVLQPYGIEDQEVQSKK